MTSPACGAPPRVWHDAVPDVWSALGPARLWARSLAMNHGDRGVYLSMTDRPLHLDAWRDAPYDAVIVGGGPAGLSAALVLGRANKRVLVVDDERPANAVSHGVGGLLGHDRVKPAALRRSGRRQLEEHANVEVRHGAVEDVEPTAAGFVVTPTDAAPVRAHALVLAHGLRYDPPPLPGIEALWGRSVFHCASCDGWEVRDRPLALHASGPGAVRSALVLAGWKPPRDLSAGAHAGIGLTLDP